jgi:hypothetical protein
MRKYALSLGPALLALGLAACGGGSPSTTSPTPGPTCGPSSLQAQLVYPAPGSTGVSDNLPEVVVAVNQPLPVNEWDLALYQGNTFYLSALFFQQISASQLPNGSAATTIANPYYELVSLSANLGSKTTYQTALNDYFSSTNCTPFTVPGGTFTTL